MMAETRESLQIIAARPLSGRSLRLEFNNGAIRLFDGRRLRGPKYIPLMDPDIFTETSVEDGQLSWPKADLSCTAAYIYQNSVPYDEHAQPKKYIPTKKERMQERIAMILFPLMAIAGIAGLLSWYFNH